jgi:hypothetical protein
VFANPIATTAPTKKPSMTASIAKITNDIYDLLAALDAQDRSRVVGAVAALFGDESQSTAKQPDKSDGGSVDEGVPESFGTKAKRWMRQEKVSVQSLEQVFHVGDDGKVELIATTIPGATMKEQTGHVYLLSGIRSLLQSDEPSVDNTAAVAYCKHVGCYDKNNHTANRAALGNRMAGSVANGFTLPAPGLKAAAALVKKMTEPTE